MQSHLALVLESITDAVVGSTRFASAVDAKLEPAVESEVESALEYLDDKIGAAVESALEDRIDKAVADALDNQSDKIDKSVETALQSRTVTADEIEGLDDAISEALDNTIKEALRAHLDDSDWLRVVVQNEVRRQLEVALQPAVRQALAKLIGGVLSDMIK